MKSVGQILKISRESKNITIADVASELKISSETLVKIEADKINNDQDLVFNLGHLRSYSKYLLLDDEIIVQKFREQNVLNTIEVPDVIARPSFDNKYLNYFKLVPFSLIILIFTSFYILFINQDNSTEYALVPDLPELYEPIIEKESLNIVDTEKKIVSELNYSNSEYINNSSALASNKISLENKEIITLKFLNPTWFQVRDKSESIVLSKLMEKNEEYTYSAEKQYTITAGNAGNILVLIDNNVRGKIGKQGEVVDSLYIDNKFYN